MLERGVDRGDEGQNFRTTELAEQSETRGRAVVPGEDRAHHRLAVKVPGHTQAGDRRRRENRGG